MTKHIRIRDWGKSLGSRARAAEVRQYIAAQLDNGDSVRLDFGGVDVASPSFVDELVGKLFVAYEQHKLRQHLKIVGTDAETRALIRRMVSERTKKD